MQLCNKLQKEVGKIQLLTSLISNRAELFTHQIIVWIRVLCLNVV